MLPESFQIDGDFLIVNIALPENLGGLSVVNRDPRKSEYRPDVYVGVAEKLGPDCELVSVGDKIVFERWEYSQHDVDEARILIREVDVLILKDEQPAPGIVAMQIMDEEIKTDLVVPDTVQLKELKCWFGRVIATGTDEVAVGQFVWARKMDSYQYRRAEHMIIFRAMDDVIMMVADIVPEKETLSVH